MQSNRLISREEEQRVLEQCYKSDNPEFIGIWGRRRVGKTFLVKSFFGAKKNAIFLIATGLKDGSMENQIQNFTDSIADAFIRKGVKLEAEKNWRRTFKMLNDYIADTPKERKIVLFFDEFPWMATRNSKLLQNLEYFWNQYWSQDNRIKLIICGSSSGWILKNIINNKGGLYNRVTHTLHLEPFTLNETRKFLSSRGVKLNNKQIAEIYMVLGGIPYYLTQVKPGLSATQAIENMAFSKDNFLLNEFDKLFATLFNNAKDCIEIVRFLAKHRYGIGQEELFKSLPHLSSGGTLVGLLNDLEEAGFIMNFMPKWHKRRGKYYRVIDEYTLFYFYWIEPLKDGLLIKGMRKGYWETIQASPEWQGWKGYAFEGICYKHLIQIGNALNLSPTALPSTWRYVPQVGSKEQGAQIDLLFDRDDDTITVCEIKFTAKPFEIDKQYANNLNNKVDVFKKITRMDKQIFVALISANGIKPTMYSEELISHVVTLDDLFKEQ